jgi:hypothetical protein
MVYQMKGELDKALDYYQQALDIFEAIGAKLHVEHTKRNIEAIRAQISGTGESNGVV